MNNYISKFINIIIYVIIIILFNIGAFTNYLYSKDGMNMGITQTCVMDLLCTSNLDTSKQNPITNICIAALVFAILCIVALFVILYGCLYSNKSLIFKGSMFALFCMFLVLVLCLSMPSMTSNTFSTSDISKSLVVLILSFCLMFVRCGFLIMGV